MAPKFAVFLACVATMSLLSFINVSGCETGCSSPVPPPPPTPPSGAICRYNITELNACLTLSVITYGDACCSLLQGLGDLEAAACACLCLGPLTVDANVLLKKCGRSCPSWFTCPR